MANRYVVIRWDRILLEWTVEAGSRDEAIHIVSKGLPDASGVVPEPRIAVEEEVSPMRAERI